MDSSEWWSKRMRGSPKWGRVRAQIIWCSDWVIGWEKCIRRQRQFYEGDCCFFICLLCNDVELLWTAKHFLFAWNVIGMTMHTFLWHADGWQYFTMKSNFATANQCSVLSVVQWWVWCLFQQFPFGLLSNTPMKSLAYNLPITRYDCSCPWHWHAFVIKLAPCICQFPKRLWTAKHWMKRNKACNEDTESVRQGSQFGFVIFGRDSLRIRFSAKW